MWPRCRSERDTPGGACVPNTPSHRHSPLLPPAGRSRRECPLPAPVTYGVMLSHKALGEVARRGPRAPSSYQISRAGVVAGPFNLPFLCFLRARKTSKLQRSVGSHSSTSSFVYSRHTSCASLWCQATVWACRAESDPALGFVETRGWGETHR